MSIQLRAEHVIATLVDNLLPVGSEKGLYICLRVDLSNYKAEFNGNGEPVPYDGPDGDNCDPAEATRYVHFLFLRPTRYTKVWSAYTTRYGRPDVITWEMTSDHDSCWRQDGFSIMHKAEVALDKQVLLKDQCSGDLHQFTCLERIEHVEITYKPSDSYKKQVLSVK